MDLAQIANELYAVPPGDFVEARNTRAKQVHDAGMATQVRKLAKPSVAAYVVNHLVRHRHDDMARLIELGSELRRAQAELDGAELRKLDQQRRSLTRTIAQQGLEAAAEAGTSVSAAAAIQVEETLHAAMADPEAADAVLGGRLTRALAATGFGPVDVEGAVAVAGASASVTSLAERRASHAAATERAALAARNELSAAERAAAAAVAAAERARTSLDDVQGHHDGLQAEIRRLRSTLAEAEHRFARSETQVRDARHAAAQAESAEEDALATQDAARVELDRLTTRNRKKR